MGSHAAAQRSELVAALQAVPPAAPTLCAGWTALDLAAHVVSRERRLDAGPGIVIHALAGWTDRVRAGYARRPYPELIDLIASGPPWTSLYAVPGVDATLNLIEFLIHTEDVRRAQPGWQPRELGDDLRDVLWNGLRRAARWYFRSVTVPLVLARPDGAELTVAAKGDAEAMPPVRLTGEPEELLLMASGRRTHARVDTDGTPEALAIFTTNRLGL